MRKPFIAGNWKLNLSVEPAVELAGELVENLRGIEDIEIAMAPVFTVLSAVNEVIIGSNIGLCAQDVFWEESGAYTGEVGPQMLKDVGCAYVIIGHSERRQYFGETDQNVNKKVKAVLAKDLVPIICVGEKLEEREAGKPLEVVERQLRGALDGVVRSDAESVVIAYEPVWAIGTGRTATPEQAQEVHSFIRKILSQLYDSELAESIRIQYGGSVKPENIAELIREPDIDGALVGGASLKAESFTAIIQNARQALGLK